MVYAEGNRVWTAVCEYCKDAFQWESAKGDLPGIIDDQPEACPRCEGMKRLIREVLVECLTR